MLEQPNREIGARKNIWQREHPDTYETNGARWLRPLSTNYSFRQRPGIVARARVYWRAALVTRRREGRIHCVA